jgi:hypothetical protein
MPGTISVVLLLIASLGTSRYSSAQNVHVPLPQNQPQSQDLTIGSRPSAAPVATEDQIQKQQAMAANRQRQVEIRRDTEKMGVLIEELRDYLARVDQAVMPVDAIKKAEQIEKLAHGVKSKMKQLF